MSTTAVDPGRVSSVQVDRGEPGAGEGPRRRRGTIVAGVVAVALLIALALIGGPTPPETLYHPRGTGPYGLAALVELLEEVDAEVDISTEIPVDTSARLFVPVDRLGATTRTAVLEWVVAGGTLVVAGPTTLHDLPLAESPFSDLFGATSRETDCDLPSLREVGSIEHGAWQALVVPDGAWACYRDGGEGAWLVAEERGEGLIVALGSAAPFANGALDRADNPVLAAALLAPSPQDRLVVMPPDVEDEGLDPIAFVPAGFWRFLLLLSAAVVVVVIWQARRLGRHVPEHLPPVLPSAELARSVGDLLQRARDRQGAGAWLRQDARSAAASALGVPVDVSAARLAQLVSRRAGVDHDDARLALVDAPVTDDDQLTSIARACSLVRREVRRPRLPAADHRG